MRTIVNLIVILTAGAATLPAYAGTVERARYVMGSRCVILASHPRPGEAVAAVEEALDEIARWDRILSDWTDSSELARLNAAGGPSPVPVSADLFRFLERSIALAEQASGAFDPTIGPLVDLYRLRSGGRWPSEEELQAARRGVGFRHLGLHRSNRTVSFLAAGMRLDPGAVGKGFALDAAAALLRARGVDWALLDFGRQVLAVGEGPGGCGFPVEIEESRDGSGSPMVVHLKDASAATSSQIERGLVVDGRPMGHVLDPRTGVPVERTGQATAVAPSAAVADALSTAILVLGPEEGFRVAGAMQATAAFAGAGGSPILSSGFHHLSAERCAGSPPIPPARFNSSGQGAHP